MFGDEGGFGVLGVEGVSAMDVGNGVVGVTASFP